MGESMHVHELAGPPVQQHRCSGLMESVACGTIAERRRKYYLYVLRGRLHLGIWMGSIPFSPCFCLLLNLFYGS